MIYFQKSSLPYIFSIDRIVPTSSYLSRVGLVMEMLLHFHGRGGHHSVFDLLVNFYFTGLPVDSIWKKLSFQFHKHIKHCKSKSWIYILNGYNCPNEPLSFKRWGWFWRCCCASWGVDVTKVVLICWSIGISLINWLVRYQNRSFWSKLWHWQWWQQQEWPVELVVVVVVVVVVGGSV